MPRKQVNVELEERLIRKLREDAVRSNRSLATVVNVILSDFMGAWSAEERRKFYATESHKTSGRKLV